MIKGQFFIDFGIQIIKSLRLSMSLKCFLILVKMFEKDLDIRCKPLLDKGFT